MLAKKKTPKKKILVQANIFYHKKHFFHVFYPSENKLKGMVFCFEVKIQIACAVFWEAVKSVGSIYTWLCEVVVSRIVKRW